LRVSIWAHSIVLMGGIRDPGSKGCSPS